MSRGAFHDTSQPAPDLPDGRYVIHFSSVRGAPAGT